MKRVSRFGRLASVFTITFSLLLGTGSTVEAGPKKPTKQAVINTFYRDNASFLALKAKGGGGFDWSDNGCSVPWQLKVTVQVSNFAAEWFRDQCKQHDFGYRNFGGDMKLDQSASRRRSVDDHFLVLMLSRCGSWVVRITGTAALCQAMARSFHLAVRAFGKIDQKQ